MTAILMRLSIRLPLRRLAWSWHGLALLAAVVLAAGSWAAEPRPGLARFPRFHKGGTVAFGMREGDRVRKLSGDLVFTGTPVTTSTLKPGDVVEVEIEGVGRLCNSVVAAAGGKGDGE